MALPAAYCCLASVSASPMVRCPVELAGEFGHQLGRVGDRVGIGVAVARVGHPERPGIGEGLGPVVDWCW